MIACGGSEEMGVDAASRPFVPTDVRVIAAGENHPNGIVADEHAVYFISDVKQTMGNSPNVIRRVDLVTLEVTTLVADIDDAIRLYGDDDNLYFATAHPRSRIVRVSKSDGTVRELATNQQLDASRLAVADEALYWVNARGANTTLRTVNKDGSGLRDVGSVSGLRLIDLEADSNQIYAMSDRAVVAIDVTTGAHAELATVPRGTSNNLASDANNLYWSDRTDDTIKRLPKTGGSPTTIASNQPVPSRIAIAADGTVVWACHGASGPGTTTLGAVMKLVPGAASPEVIASGLDHAIEPSLLPQAVIWTVYGPLGEAPTGGSVMAAPR